MPRTLTLEISDWPYRVPFATARGAATQCRLLSVDLREGDAHGRGEAAPIRRYGHTVDTVAAEIEGVRGPIEAGATRAEIAGLLPASPARNALDCALWDLEAKVSGRTVWQLATLAAPRAIVTVYTLSVAEPAAMAAQALAHADLPMLKLKLGGAGDIERVRAVRAAAPRARLLADANESWTPELYLELAPQLAALGVELLEQPFAAAADEMLAQLPHPLPICADESCHSRADLPRLAGCYDYINIKLDKSGGLTEALLLAADAKARGLRLMVGCMSGTSLGMAPAHLVAQLAEFADLDGPLLLACDREPAMVYRRGVVEPPAPALWG